MDVNEELNFCENAKTKSRGPDGRLVGGGVRGDGRGEGVGW